MRMVTPEQAREVIWPLIDAAGPYKLAAKAGLSPSLLYQYRDGKTRLGHESVSALRQILDGVPPDVWLAAMGVEASKAAAPEAGA